MKQPLTAQPWYRIYRPEPGYQAVLARIHAELYQAMGLIPVEHCGILAALERITGVPFVEMQQPSFTSEQ